MARIAVSGRVANTTRILLRDWQYVMQTDGSTNGKVDFGTHASYLLNTGALSFWIKKASGSGNQGGVELYVSGNDRITIYHVGNAITCGFVRGGSVILNSGVTLTNYLSQWNHILITWDSTSALLFHNGNTSASLTSSGDRTMNFPSNPQLQIGTSLSGSFNIDARFGDLAICNAKLAGTDAANIYYRNLLPSSLVARWRFTDGSGNVSLSSGSGNSGTKGSGATWITETPFKLRTAKSGRVTP